jgi:hypothetical protein
MAWVPETGSCGDLILVDEPAEQIGRLTGGGSLRTTQRRRYGAGASMASARCGR